VGHTYIVSFWIKDNHNYRFEYSYEGDSFIKMILAMCRCKIINRAKMISLEWRPK
jgi:hypothetical protein